MRQTTFLIPGDLQRRTGGYEYDRRIVAGLRARGWRVSVIGLDGSFPEPTSGAMADAGDALAALPDGATVIVDGLALGAMPEPASAHAHRLRLVALVHHPLALETGITPILAERLRASEQRALACVAQVIVTSRGTAGALADYGVAPDRVAVVEPGTDPAPLASASTDGLVRLVCVASISPRKGHEVLVRALANLGSTAWRLTCVGSGDRDSSTGDALRALLRARQLERQVALVGEADAARTAGYYHESDAFVLATRYEGYGMVVAEAVARGLPVVSTPTGAIPDLVGSEGGVLVEPGDVEGWTNALRRVLDPGERARFAAAARRRRETLPTWDAAASLFERALGHV